MAALAIVATAVCRAATAQEIQAESADAGSEAPVDGSSERTAAHQPVIVKQKVLREPSAEEIGALYPKGAARENLGGEVRIVCQVALSTKLENCEVQKETPQGYGFGAAALKTVDLFRVAPPTVDGEPVSGTRFSIPFRYVISPSSRAVRSAEPASQARPAIKHPPSASRPGMISQPPPKEVKRAAVRSDGALWVPAMFCVATLSSLAMALFAPARQRRKRKAGQYA